MSHDFSGRPDSGLCAPTSAPPTFTDCSGFGITFTLPHSEPSAIIFLNRFGGTYRQGFNSSINNTSSIISGTRTIPPFAGTNTAWNEILNCVREEYAPFNVSVVDVEPPPTARYTEAVVGGLPSAAGFGNGVGGVSPFYCSPAINTIVFVFSAAYGNFDNPNRLICETIAQEVGHSFTLDHEFLCEDPMTYLDGCGDKTFQDQDAPCGEFSARACLCGGNTQNSVARLTEILGSSGDALRSARLQSMNEAVEPVGVCVVPVPDRR